MSLCFFTVDRPSNRPDMTPFKFINCISCGLQIQQFGNESSSRDYTYISDIIYGVIRSIDRPYPHKSYDVCDACNGGEVTPGNHIYFCESKSIS